MTCYIDYEAMRAEYHRATQMHKGIMLYRADPSQMSLEIHHAYLKGHELEPNPYREYTQCYVWFVAGQVRAFADRITSTEKEMRRLIDELFGGDRNYVLHADTP